MFELNGPPAQQPGYTRGTQAPSLRFALSDRPLATRLSPPALRPSRIEDAREVP